jgi:coenzyme F420-reducing hydrogenase delta subunit
MCCRRLDPSIVLGILSEGIDGVMITTCSLGGCNFIKNHEQVEKKFLFTKRLLEKASFESERVALEYLFASEGRKFADQVDKFIEKVRGLGPSPLSGDSPDPDLLLNLRAVKAVAENYRLRALVGKEEKLVTEGNIYGEPVSQEELDTVMDDAVDNEYIHHKIRLTLLEEPASVKKLSEKLDIDSRKILEHIVAMRQLGWVDVKEILGSSPIYKALEVPE